jgi:hypothetical protein
MSWRTTITRGGASRRHLFARLEREDSARLFREGARPCARDAAGIARDRTEGVAKRKRAGAPTERGCHSFEARAVGPSEGGTAQPGNRVGPEGTGDVREPDLLALAGLDGRHPPHRDRRRPADTGEADRSTLVGTAPGCDPDPRPLADTDHRYGHGVDQATEQRH